MSDAAIECAMETIAACRIEASRLRQAGLKVLADWHKENANAAERWIVQQATLPNANRRQPGRG